MFVCLIFLFLISIILIAAIRPMLKGKFGENQVARLLKNLPEGEYTVFNNLLIKRDIYSSQIDHVVVSRYGIFVIETKNYQGYIYGGENQYKWTQNIWGNKYQFYNPILQNQSHIKALKHYLGIACNPFVSIVAFAPRATLKSIFPNHYVCYYSDILRLIRRQDGEVLSNDEINHIVQMLSKLPKFTQKAQRNHTEYVHYQESKNEMSIYNGRCPRCGGTLVARDGQYGHFYGCSNYPRCKFTYK